MDTRIQGLSILLALMLTATATAEVQLLRCGRVWDGNGRIWSNATIVIDGDTIASVESDVSEVPAGAKEIDLTQFTVVPGLIDVHTHMTYGWDGRTGTRPLQQRVRPAMMFPLAKENARKTLETGVTTVRDLNAPHAMDMAMRDLIKMEAMIGPRMFISGRGIEAVAGPPTPEQTARLTEERINAGNDWVKLFASTGSYADVTGQQTIPFESIKAAVDTAHAMGKRIAVHSYGPDAARDAVKAGADSIEHAVDLDADTLRAMARNNVFYVPTIDHNRYYLENQELYEFPPGAAEKMKTFMDRNVETARRAHQMGVRLVMGSDAVFTMFGQNTRELEWFVNAGMTPEQALTSATVNGAELLGIDDRLGKIQPGFTADIVAVKGDPLTNIATLRTGVRWVMKYGAIVVDKR